MIETARFKAGVLTPHPGLLHSEDMVVTERLSLSEDGNQLIKEYSVVDPQYLSKPVTGRSAWNRSDIALPKYNCVELGGSELCVAGDLDCETLLLVPCDFCLHLCS